MPKPVVIIGAGPAGLACASHLVCAGLPVVMLDDNRQAGGQYFRQLPPTYEVLPESRLLREAERGKRLFSVLEHPLVRYFPLTTAWAAPQPLTIAYAGPDGAGKISARAVVIASGAQDAPLPFPGWTLPGIITAGGCLNLAKGHGLIPPGKIVVAGNGPLVLVAAAMLAAAGAEVTHVLEAQPTARVAAAMARGLFQAPALVMKGIGYRARLLASGTRFRSGWMIAQAFGTAGLEGLEAAPVGSDGRPDLSCRLLLEAQTLVTGYGLLPGIELARLMGCRMMHSPGMGGWVPVRSDYFETSLPHVYAVGDGAGIGGVEVALIEGHLAANAIIDRNCLDKAARRRYQKLDRFRHILARAYRPKTGLAAADNDTIICRCEELRLKELKASVLAQDKDLDRLKASTRLGMGRCQGRNCLVSAAALLGLEQPEAAMPFPRARPPARLIRMQDVIRDRSIGPVHEPDEITVPLTQENH